MTSLTFNLVWKLKACFSRTLSTPRYELNNNFSANRFESERRAKITTEYERLMEAWLEKQKPIFNLTNEKRMLLKEEDSNVISEKCVDLRFYV